jgi:hypothetical protein
VKKALVLALCAVGTPEELETGRVEVEGKNVKEIVRNFNCNYMYMYDIKLI